MVMQSLPGQNVFKTPDFWYIFREKLLQDQTLGNVLGIKKRLKQEVGNTTNSRDCPLALSVLVTLVVMSERKHSGNHSRINSMTNNILLLPIFQGFCFSIRPSTRSEMNLPTISKAFVSSTSAKNFSAISQLLSLSSL